VFSSNEDTSFDMPDLFFDDQQDAVFILKFEPTEVRVGGKITPVKALVSYTLKGGSQVSKEVALEVELAGEDEEVTLDKDVQLEYYRVRGAETLRKIAKKADEGLLEEARKAGREFQVELEACSVRDNLKIQYLLKDIVDAQVRTQNVNSWESGGRAQVVSVSNTHTNKISSNNCVSYQKPMQAMYSVSSNIYAQSLPVRRINNTVGPGLGIGGGAQYSHPIPPPQYSSLNSCPMPQQYNPQPYPVNLQGTLRSQPAYPAPQQMQFVNPLPNQSGISAPLNLNPSANILQPSPPPPPSPPSNNPI